MTDEPLAVQIFHGILILLFAPSALFGLYVGSVLALQFLVLIFVEVPYMTYQNIKRRFNKK